MLLDLDGLVHVGEVPYCDPSEIDFGGIQIASVVWELLVACDIIALVIDGACLVRAWTKIQADYLQADGLDKARTYQL